MYGRLQCLQCSQCSLCFQNDQKPNKYIAGKKVNNTSHSPAFKERN